MNASLTTRVPAVLLIVLSPALRAQTPSAAPIPPADTTMARPFVVPPGGSRSPGKIAVKVSGADNNGAFAVLEVPTAKGAAPPLHMHHVENEWFYVLEGAYDVRVGDLVVHLTPGGSVYGPRMIPHTWRDVGESGGRLLVVAQPAGQIEAFTRDLEALTAAGPPDPKAFAAIFAKHNMEIVGPPLPKPAGAQ